MAAKKDCELCGNPARMFCESDQASLCWSCDEKVHAANFLVAKHSRTLLCHACHSPTPWKAAGAKLGPTASVCRACADGESRSEDAACDSAESENDAGGEYDSDSDDCSHDDDDDATDEEEDGENQVVPWTAAAVAEENASVASSSKRTRDSPFESEDEEGCCSVSETNYRESPEGVLRPLKTRRMSNDGGTAAIVEKLRRFQQGMAAEGGGDILGLCKLTRY